MPGYASARAPRPRLRRSRRDGDACTDGIVCAWRGAVDAGRSHDPETRHLTLTTSVHSAIVTAGRAC